MSVPTQASPLFPDGSVRRTPAPPERRADASGPVGKRGGLDRGLRHFLVRLILFAATEIPSGDRSGGPLQRSRCCNLYRPLEHRRGSSA